ncbi:erythromycin esterase family protein [Actinoplanes sp. CA-142083]|uniref:erythromycin esterase family protein n=1 Tax=Actinoplanes sp. CA-142083 TaxID=3239903 RepID=UPI003D8EAB29
MTIAIDDVMKARPRLLALGEPTHGEDVLLDVRNELFRHLVEHDGFRAIAIESDCLMGLVVDDYVTAGKGTLDAAMALGFSHEFGKSAANRELVRWLRSYNESRPSSEQVHFAGFDGPLEISHAASPRQALTELHSYLGARVDAALLPCTADELDRLLGADDRWANPETMMDLSQSIGRTPEARALRLLADDLAALLESQPPALRDSDRARLHARTATGLLRYHYWLADTSPGRLPWLLTVRASMMAANLLALVEKGPMMAFAQNSHFQRARSSMRLGDLPLQWWSAGAIVDAHLGDDYAFLAMALGTIRHHGVGTPPPDTIEGILYARAGDRFIVDPRTLGQPTPRESPWFGYAPLDPAHLPSIDAIVYVKDTGSA